MLASIVIRAYNEEKRIARLLEGIAQQTVKGVETIVVDSGSTDGTLEAAGRFPVQVVQVEPERFSFGYSLNQGISKSKGELIVIASAHIYPVYPDWLERLLAPFNDSQVALAYGKQRGDETTLFSESQVFSHWYPEASQTRQTHPFCNNANAAIRRSCWDLHPYDETLPGLEDLEWGHWALRQGFGIAYVAEAEIRHVHAETPSGVYNRYRREGMAFKRIFPHEHFNLADFLRLYFSNSASDLWHASQQGRLGKSFGNILWFRLMQFWGTYRGFHSPGQLTQQLRQTFYYPHNLRLKIDTLRRDIKPIQYEDKPHVER